MVFCHDKHKKDQYILKRAILPELYYFRRKYNREGLFNGLHIFLECEADEEGTEEFFNAIRDEGGVLVDEMVTADMVISQYKLDHQQSYDGTTVTPYWLARVLKDAKLSLPRRPLDFPCPFESIERGESVRLCISGFSMDERLEIEAMCCLAGASFFKNLDKSVVNILISSKPDTPKLKYAREWNITVVDLKWLIDSFTIWKWRPLGDYLLMK